MASEAASSAPLKDDTQVNRKIMIPPDISLPDLSCEIERVAALLCDSLNDRTFANGDNSPILPYVSVRFEAVWGIAHSGTTSTEFDDHMRFFERKHAKHPNTRYRLLSVTVDSMLLEAGRVDAHLIVEITGGPEGMRRETAQCHKWRNEGEEGWRWFQMVTMRGQSSFGPL